MTRSVPLRAQPSVLTPPGTALTGLCESRPKLFGACTDWPRLGHLPWVLVTGDGPCMKHGTGSVEAAWTGAPRPPLMPWRCYWSDPLVMERKVTEKGKAAQAIGPTTLGVTPCPRRAARNGPPRPPSYWDPHQPAAAPLLARTLG